MGATDLKGIPEVDQEGVVETCEHVELPDDVVDGLLAGTHGFIHVLHGEHALRVLLLHDAHLHAHT